MGNSTRHRVPRHAGALACALVAAVGLAGAPSVDAYTIYTDASLFKPAAPGAVLEDFGDGNPAVNAGLIPNRLDPATNNGVFSTGDISSGLSIENVNTGDGTTPNDNIKLFESSWFGMTLPAGQTNAISNTNDGWGLVLVFLPTVSAVGFEVYYEGKGQPDRSVGVTFLDALGNAVLPEIEITSEAYIGIVAGPGDAPIARVIIDNPFGALNGRFEAVDNVAFAQVPEPASALLLALGLGLLRGARRS